MTNQIIKRDGRIVSFNKDKVVNAISRAMNETELGVDTELAMEIANAVEREDSETASVESIQDMVEKLLMGSDRKEVAKAYILYRAERTKQRNFKNEIIQKVWEKTSAAHVENANANVDESTFGGRKNEAASVLQKEIALNMNMAKDVAQAHKDGLIYQHDLDHYNLGAHNCLNIDFEYLFKNGFKTRNADIRPPSSFSTACQLVAVIFQIQSQCQFGGVSSSHIDYDLAPFVHMSFIRHLKDGLKYLEFYRFFGDKESIAAEVLDAKIGDMAFILAHPAAYQYAIDMLEREGSQAAQGLVHNLGTLESRAGSQVPFSSINYGRDISPEGRMVTRWLLEASIEGIGKHHTTSIFPIGIFACKKGVNVAPGDPNYDLKQLAMKSMSLRIFPNWINCDWTEAHEDPEDKDTNFSTMG